MHTDGAESHARAELQKVLGCDRAVIHKQVHHHVSLAGLQQNCHLPVLCDTRIGLFASRALASHESSHDGNDEPHVHDAEVNRITMHPLSEHVLSLVDDKRKSRPSKMSSMPSFSFRTQGPSCCHS